MVSRLLFEIINNKIVNKGKALILLGARQTGKTTLLKQIMGTKTGVLWLNGDEMDTMALFENASSTRLKNIFAGNSIIIIDEAQRIENIGLRLKLITDQIPEVQVIDPL